MHRWTTLVRDATGAVVVLWAQAAAPLLLLAALGRRAAPPPGFVRHWCLTWGPLLLVGAAHALATRAFVEALGWSLAGLLIGLVVAGRGVTTFRGLALGLLVLTACLGAELVAAATTWSPANAVSVQPSRYAAVFAPQVLDGPTTFERVWRAPAEGSAVVSVDVRAASGEAGWSWFQYDAGFTVAPLAGHPAGYARVEPPEHGGSYVTRRVDTGAPLAGRTFRARLRLRTSEPFAVADGACRGVLLRELGGSGAVACFPATLDGEWSDLAFTWQVPETASSPIVRIELRLSTAWFDVGDVELDEATPDGWRSLGPLEPAGLRLTGVVPATPAAQWPTVVVVPNTDWQTVTLRIDDTDGRLGDDLRVLLRPEVGSAVEVRGATARAGPDPGAATLTPSPRPLRRTVWFEHPNLAGHGLAMAGLLTTAAAPTPAAALVSGALTLAGVALTGSRTAWLVALVAVSFVLLRAPAVRRRRLLVGAAVVLAVAALVATSLPGSTPASIQILGRGAANEVTRTEIVRFAWTTMLEHPLTGIGARPFDEHWALRRADDPRTPPRHGHNLWLHLGAAYGVPGLLAALWLSGGLLLAARRWGGSGTTLLVVAALALQLADLTLGTAGVLTVVCLAFQRQRSTPPGR